MVGLHHHPDLLPLQGQLTAATSRQNRPSTRRALSLDPGASTCSECYYAYYLGDVHRSAFIEGDLERNFGSKCLPGLLHHHFMFFHVSNYTNQSASLESASCLRRKRDYVVAPEFIGGPTSLPTGNRAPSGAVIFSRISVFVAKKHSRSILRKMLLECFFATKTLMRERITENTRVQFPVGTKVRRGHLVYVASGITSSRQSSLADRPAFLPGTGPLRGL